MTAPLPPHPQTAPGVNQTVLQGEFKTSRDPNVVMTTLLGSCISACIWDARARIGGMNHFLLPGDDQASSENMRFGINSMELLVNALISQGASRSNLQVRLFGGAKMFDGGPNIGQRNTEFARWFLENEGLNCVGACVGGNLGRKIRFWPVSGRAQRKFMDDARGLFQREMQTPAVPPARKRDSGDVELF